MFILDWEQKVLKMYYFLVARPLHPPLPVSGLATKKNTVFCGFSNTGLDWT